MDLLPNPGRAVLHDFSDSGLLEQLLDPFCFSAANTGIGHEDITVAAPGRNEPPSLLSFICQLRRLKDVTASARELALDQKPPTESFRRFCQTEKEE
jgi:hypothetical protein